MTLKKIGKGPKLITINGEKTKVVATKVMNRMNLVHLSEVVLKYPQIYQQIYLRIYLIQTKHSSEHAMQLFIKA